MGRDIKPALVDIIDKRLVNNGLALELVTKKGDKDAARSLYLLVNEHLVGIREKGGNNSGPEVKLISETIGTWSKESWCMGAQQSAIAYVEEKLDIPSPVFASEHCLTVWQKTPKAQRVKIMPAPGALIIWQHGKTTNGHTGCLKRLLSSYTSKSKKRYAWTADAKVKYPEFWRYMEALEGNTEAGLNEKGDIQREGGGFYLTKRSTEANGTMKVVGFLKPW